MAPLARLVVGPPLHPVLDTILSTPGAGPSTYPPVPSVDELIGCSSSLLAARNAAEARAAGCRDAARLQREAVERVTRRADEDRRGKDRERERVDKERKKREESIRRDGELKASQARERERDGLEHPKGKERDGANGGTASPAFRVKRELSASPAPVHNGDLTPSAPPRKKKRKLDQVVSTASPELADRPDAAARTNSHTHSRYNSPAVERAHTPGMPGSLKLKLKVQGDGPSKPGRPLAQVAQSRPDWTPPPTVHHNIAFSHPSSSSSSRLVPARPPIPPPPKPGPKRQKDVNEDFTQVKHTGAQVQLSSFWTTLEGYLRDVSEDDLAMLGFRANDPEPYTIPPLGRHYQEVWDEEDLHMPFGNANAAPSSANPPDALPPRDKRLANRPKRFVPVRDMADDDLYDDLKGLGGLAERLLAGMVREEGHGKGGAAGKQAHALAQAAEAAGGPAGEGGIGAAPVVPSITVNGQAPLTNGHAGPSAAHPVEDADTYDWPIEPHKITNRGDKERANAVQVDMVDLEEGLRRELRHLGLLGLDEEIDYTMRQDDEITAALRQCQTLLGKQIAINDARKNRLAEIARDRLAYGEYKHTLAGLESVIAVGWQRRQSRKARKGKSKEKEKDEVYLTTTRRSAASAAPFPEQVKKAIETRRKWIEAVGVSFDDPDVVARFKEPPTQSIYEGIEEDGADTRDVH